CYRHGAPRDLRPLPTRRSAELEGGEVGEVSEMRWLIDPLDGTDSFAHGIPIFCVSVGLRGPDGPVLGVIYDPLRDECLSALRGRSEEHTSELQSREKLVCRLLH